MTDSTKMPIGTTNSTLKTCFSLTSLRSFTPADSLDHNNPLKLNNNERLYHSLTKKSRKSNEKDKELWRKSWGSVISQDGKEFWEGFQADYDYLMAQNILEKTVSETSMEEVPALTPMAPLVWTHSEFMDHFAQLYSWLKGIQDLIYGKQENVTDWKLRAERQEDMQRQKFRLDVFNDQSKKLMAKYPEMEKEVSWLTQHVNDKWETVEGLMGVCPKEGDKRAETGSQEKVDHEVRCLRRWLRELDGKLKPLSFHGGWTKAELEMKTKEHMVLHRDIEAHRKIVSSVFKLCEKADASTFRAARALERKYHEYYLRSLEWQYHIESLIGLQVNKSPPSLSNDSDGEPVAKIARFAYRRDSDVGKTRSHVGRVALMKEEVKEDRVVAQSNLEMDVASTVVKSHDRASARTMDLKENDESILRVKDFLPAESPSFAAKSNNFNGFSVGKRPVNDATENSVSTTPTVLNELAEKDQPQVKNILFPAESNRSPNLRPPNIATFSCKHLDTDSEQEKMKISEGGDGKEEEITSSEDDWTYQPCRTQVEKNCELSGGKVKVKSSVVAARKLDFEEAKPVEMKYFSAKSIPKTNRNKLISNKELISSSNRKLVDQADELYRCKSSKSYRSKQARLKVTKDGKECEKPLDSCDASGEYTEDSDERESQFSEDNNSSIGTCKRSGSAEGILDEESSEKTRNEVSFRNNKSLASRNRPLSMVNVSAMMRNSRSSFFKSRSSMSESALNQIFGQLDKSRDFYCVHKSGKLLNSAEDGTWGNCGSLRKRKTKFRKRWSKRSNTDSDGQTLSGSDSVNLSSPAKQITSWSGLVKSGSFSGVSRKQRDFSPTFTKCGSGSGTETDEERVSINPPKFRLGPKDGAVTLAPAEREKIIQVEEHLSLNSDQAYWDNYQEKYQSEAYSEEPADSDTAKKLLEFGEDYGNFLGNQSDGVSYWDRSMKSRSPCKFDSDSDVDEVKRFLRQSVGQLDLVEMKLSENNCNSVFAVGNVEEDSVSKTFLDEIITICRRNVDSLTKLLNEVSDEMHIPKRQNCIQDVKESWEGLKTTAELHKAKQLKSDMMAIKNELMNWAAGIESMETTVTSREELEAKIIQIKNELNSMKKGKNKLLQANVSVHRFLSTAKHVEPTLRDEVTELYRVWDQTFSRVSSQLLNLQSLSQAWHDFDDHLSQLQCALRTDTLKVIDFALQCGTSSDVTGSLKDIAVLLSDKESVMKDVVCGPEEQTVAGAIPKPVLTALSMEGSLSDSGISDSGSEQEMSEREKRLAQLKRLAKRLESILAPSSQALSNMFKRIEEAESGLRELQKTCRDLIVRSSSTEEFKMIVSKASNIGALDDSLSGVSGTDKSSCRRSKGKLQKSDDDSKKEANDEERENGGSTPRKSWLWRLVRFALPLQLALVALLCVACMMEPRCCDSFNNLEMSLNPQLRYDSGPPPV